MIGLALKPWNVCDSKKKKDVPTIKWKMKIPFFIVICGSIDFLIWVRAEVEHKGRFLENPVIHPKILNPWIPKDTYVAPI
jgi:hypothetical protein